MKIECPSCFFETEEGSAECYNCGFKFVTDENCFEQTSNEEWVKGAVAPTVIYTDIDDLPKPEEKLEEDYNASYKKCVITAICSSVLYAILSFVVGLTPLEIVIAKFFAEAARTIASIVFVLSCAFAIVNFKLVKVGKRLDLLEKENERLKSEQKKIDEDIK